MKKAILLLAISSTFIMCKKGEVATEPISEALQNTDSTLSDLSEKAEKIHEETEAVFDSAQVKIKDFDQTSKDLKEKFEKTASSIDSLGDKISNVKFDSKPSIKKDSAEKKEEKIVVNVPAPKVIKETKIVYKNTEKPQNNAISFLKKTANLEVEVNNTYDAKNYVENQIKKYDGKVRSENLRVNSDDSKTAYLRLQIPLDNFDYFMDDVTYNFGNIIDKTISSSGEKYVGKTICDIDITLYGNEKNAEVAVTKPETFGGKFSSGIDSGWDVITGIFLFFVPFWPLFLVGGIGYYFYKKKRNKGSEETSEKI